MPSIQQLAVGAPPAILQSTRGSLMQKAFLILLGIVFVTIAACNSHQTELKLRTEQESARRQFDKAALIVLGKVESASVDTARSAPDNFAAIKVIIQVDRVLKGQYNSKSLCFDYLLPSRGYEGAGFARIDAGRTGFFALEPSAGCFRVVNDRHAIFLSYSMPDTRLPPEDYFAQASFPIPGACARQSTINIPEEIDWTTISLVGSRTARRMLDPYIDSKDPAVSACACSAMATLWRLHAQCLDSLPLIERKRLTELPSEDEQLLDIESAQFHSSPEEWLNRSVERRGVDGALVDLADMTERLGDVNADTCLLFKNYLSSDSFETARAQARNWTSEQIEAAATADLHTWIDHGCRKR